MPIPNTLILTGAIYIKYIDDIAKPDKGDLILLLNDDAISAHLKTYDDTGFSGYIKAEIYDGKVWQHIDIAEFCVERENKLTKKQRPIDSFLLCREKLINYKDTILYKTYRGHFTTNVYEPIPYIRKSNNAKRKK